MPLAKRAWPWVWKSPHWNAYNSSCSPQNPGYGKCPCQNAHNPFGSCWNLGYGKSPTPLKHTWPWQWANVIVKMHLAYHIPIRTLVMVSILFGMHMAHKNIFNISSKTQIKINYAFGITKKVVSFPNKLFKISHKLVYNPHSSSNIKKYIHTISHMKFPTTFWNRIAYESSKCYNVFSLG